MQQQQQQQQTVKPRQYRHTFGTSWTADVVGSWILAVWCGRGEGCRFITPASRGCRVVACPQSRQHLRQQAHTRWGGRSDPHLLQQALHQPSRQGGSLVQSSRTLHLACQEQEGPRPQRQSRNRTRHAPSGPRALTAGGPSSDQSQWQHGASSAASSQARVGNTAFQHTFWCPHNALAAAPGRLTACKDWALCHPGPSLPLGLAHVVLKCVSQRSPVMMAPPLRHGATQSLQHPANPSPQSHEHPRAGALAAGHQLAQPQHMQPGP